MIPISVLDVSPVAEGSTVRAALLNTIDLARHAERLGFNRFWLAEHHNMAGIASAATAVLIGQVAAATLTLQVGAGGIMLPNHAPLVVAEQFGTLAALYPNRIELGLGRAPGSDQLTARALRRTLMSDENDFPRDVVELLGYFAPETSGQPVRAIPGSGLEVPLWILGSSLYGAQVAAALGLPYAFASHFAPDHLAQALEIYRARFRPSRQADRPHAMLGLNVIAAETDAEAKYLFTSVLQSFARHRRGQPGQLPPPVADISTHLSPADLAALHQVLSCSIVGSPDTLRRELPEFIARTGADELMITSQIFDHRARLRSFEIVAGVRDELG